MNVPTIEIQVAGLPITADGVLAFDTVWPDLEPSIRRFARRLTPDRDHQEELVQEAMVKLWRVDPTRYDFRNQSDVSYIRRVLINRMRNVWGDGHDGPLTMADLVGPVSVSGRIITAASDSCA